MQTEIKRDLETGLQRMKEAHAVSSAAQEQIDSVFESMRLTGQIDNFKQALIEAAVVASKAGTLGPDLSAKVRQLVMNAEQYESCDARHPTRRPHDAPHQPWDQFEEVFRSLGARDPYDTPMISHKMGRFIVSILQAGRGGHDFSVIGESVLMFCWSVDKQGWHNGSSTLPEKEKMFAKICQERAQTLGA